MILPFSFLLSAFCFLFSVFRFLFSVSAFVFSVQVNPQPVPGKLDAVRQFLLRRVMIEIVRHVREERPARADAPRRGQRLVQAHVGGMRRAAQGVQHGGFDPARLLDRRRRHLLAIAQIDQAFPALLRKEVAGRSRAPVRERQRNNFQIPQRERAADNMRFGGEIALGSGLAGEGVLEDAPQVGHCFFIGINRQRRPAPQIAKPPAIVQPHDMIGMGMGEKDGVEPADVLAQD